MKVTVALIYSTGYDDNGYAFRYKKDLFMQSYVLDILTFLTKQSLEKIKKENGIEYYVDSFNLQLKKDSERFFDLEQNLQNNKDLNHWRLYKSSTRMRKMFHRRNMA